MCVRDDDIPVFVSDGVGEFGIVGLNVLEEFALGRPDARFEIIARLGFGRCGLRLAASDRIAYGGPQSLAGARIATSYPRIVKRFLDERGVEARSEEHTSELQSLMRISYAVFCLKKTNTYK